ncbi:MAG TPA: DUF2911 domain-containing protein [Gemmatimonadales bacterium]|jgi:hypothetical protein
MVRTVVFSLCIVAALVSPPRSSAQTVDAHRLTVSAVIVGRTETAQVTLTWDSLVADGQPLLGRVIPLDKPWLLGATAPPVLATTTPLRIGSLDVPAGSFTLRAVATQNAVQLVVVRQTKSDSAEYSPDSVIGTVPMTVDSAAEPVAHLTMQIRIERFGPDASGVEMSRVGNRETIVFHPGTRTTLLIAWDRLLWSVPIAAR